MDLHSLELVLVHNHPRSAYTFITNPLATVTFSLVVKGLFFRIANHRPRYQSVALEFQKGFYLHSRFDSLRNFYLNYYFEYYFTCELPKSSLVSLFCTINVVESTIISSR